MNKCVDEEVRRKVNVRKLMSCSPTNQTLQTINKISHDSVPAAHDVLSFTGPEIME